MEDVVTKPAGFNVGCKKDLMPNIKFNNVLSIV